MSSLIEVNNLSKQFGSLLAVDRVSFNVDRGDVLGFLGPNGAGKSTTMKMITGFLEPTNGSVTVCGHTLANDSLALKSKIGYMPEGAPAYAEMTPSAFLEFIADIRGLQGSVRTARIAEVVEKIQLAGVMEQRIETLSKGFKRRVGLAQAILHDPEVLILDEPTDGLDPNQKHEVRTLIQDMAKEKAIVISTHILEEVDAVCNRCIIIADGRLAFSGTPAELEAQSKYHNAVIVTLNSDEGGAAKAKLGQLGDVESVEDLDSENPSRLRVVPREGRSIVAQVSEVVRTQAWQVSEVQVEKGHLDEVFRVITTQQNTQT